MELLFAKYPRLLDDESYRDFLKTYAGASVTVNDKEESDGWFAFLIGLDDFGGKVVPFTEEGYNVDDDGFLCIAQLYHQLTQVELNFGYYVSGAKRPGLHRILYIHGHEELRGWYCETFVEWLEKFVRIGESIFHTE